MAVADVVQGVGAAQPLVAGLDVDLRVALADPQPRVGVVVAAVDVGVHTADRVDSVLEAAELDVDDVVDLQPGELLDRLHCQRRTAQRVGLVELVGAVPGDLHAEVARQREDRGRGLVGIQPDEHHRVRPRRHRPLEPRVVSLVLVEAAIGAQHQDRLRLARLRLGDAGVGDVRAALALECLDEVVDLEQARGRGGARGERDDQQAPQRGAQQQATTGGGRDLALPRGHARPPPTARRPPP